MHNPSIICGESLGKHCSWQLGGRSLVNLRWRGEIKGTLTSIFLPYKCIFTVLQLELGSSVQEYAWYCWLYVNCEIPVSDTNWGKECDFCVWGKCTYTICGAEFSFCLFLLALMIARDIYVHIFFEQLWTLDLVFKRIQIESYTYELGGILICFFFPKT